ncbi:hypothetical protein ACQE3E_23325 (plasmid) [Methylomonas sp. MED-D]|uniref:hypothetical protein n=1 Tax=Methylomonas sp. MED-D TaxID=3418768 RepID=UPI003D093EDF
MRTDTIIGVVTLHSAPDDGGWFCVGNFQPVRVTAGVKAWIETTDLTGLLAAVVSDLLPLSAQYPWLRIELVYGAGLAQWSVTDGEGRAVMETAVACSTPNVGRRLFYWADRVFMVADEY